MSMSSMYHHTSGSPVTDSRILSLLPRQGLMTSYHIQLLQLGALPWKWILSHHQRPFTSEPALVGFVRLDRKKFLQQEWHWHRLLRDAVDAPSLETFQARLDRAVSSLVWLKISQLIAGRLDKRTFKGLLQSKPFLDSKEAQDSFSSKSCNYGIGSSHKGA